MSPYLYAVLRGEAGLIESNRRLNETFFHSAMRGENFECEELPLFTSGGNCKIITAIRTTVTDRTLFR